MDCLPVSIFQSFQDRFHDSFENVVQNTDLEDVTKQLSIKYKIDPSLAEIRFKDSLTGASIDSPTKVSRMERAYNILEQYLIKLVVDQKDSIKLLDLVDLRVYTKWCGLLKYDGYDEGILGYSIINNDKKKRSIHIFVGDTHDIYLKEPILICSFYLRAYSKDKMLPFVYGICSNLNSFRFVKYTRANNKLSLSEQIDIFPVGKLSKNYNQNKLHDVGRRMMGLALSSSEDLC